MNAPCSPPSRRGTVTHDLADGSQQSGRRCKQMSIHILGGRKGLRRRAQCAGMTGFDLGNMKRGMNAEKAEIPRQTDEGLMTIR